MGYHRTLFQRLRQQEYTGSNRCIPCTIANLVIAAVVSLITGILYFEIGILIFCLAVLVIYFRGYLVPGTPTLTDRLLPGWVHEQFGTDTQPRETTTAGSWDAIDRHKQRKENQVDAETFLRDTGTITLADDSTYELSSSFYSRTREEINELTQQPLWPETEPTATGKNHIGHLFGVSPDELRFKSESYPAVRVAARVRQWPSEHALTVDIATDRVLDSQDAGWRDFPRDQRLKILTALRSYQQSCPCGGELTETTETIDSCCRSGNVTALLCSACSKPLLERSPNTTDWFSPEDL